MNNKNEIKPSDIDNPDSLLAKSFLFLYSMETFLYSSLNKADWEGDASKIQTLGPFAFALMFKSASAQSKRGSNILSPQTLVYRGAKLSF